MTTLYIIEPTGEVTEREFDAPPDYKLLEREYFQPAHIEHVTVLWQKKRAHAFVEDGGAGRLPINLKATAIYHNSSRTQIAKARRDSSFLAYGDLKREPRNFIDSSIPFIYGRMLLWPASMPGWEAPGG